MASAIELLEFPELAIDPLTATTASKNGYSHDELAHFRIGHDDIDKVVVKIWGFGKWIKKGKRKGERRDVRRNLRPVVTEAEFEDSIDKTPTFTIIVHDPDWELLESGALDEDIDINPGRIPKRWYRLDHFSVNNDDITLVFATRNAVYMSKHKRPFKTSRGKSTRAQFILRLAKAVKIVTIPTHIPQLKRKQDQKKFNPPTEKEKEDKRSSGGSGGGGGGFTKSDNITVKHSPAGEDNLKVLSDVLQRGQEMKAPGLVIVAAIMCITQESGASNNPQPPNPPYVGAFQQNPRWWPGTGNAYTDAKAFYSKAIKYWKDHNGDADLGQMVSDVQGVTGSTNPLNAGYAQKVNSWRREAQHTVNAWGGIDVDDPGQSSSTTTTRRGRYEYMVGEPDGPKGETYLAATYRLADEVQWSAFWVKDRLHFQSQEDLFKQKPRRELKRFEDGIETISFEWDGVKKLHTMQLGVRMERWAAPVGTVVKFQGGGKADGKWLVTNVRRSMFNELGEITLSKPLKELKEPAPDPVTTTTTEGPRGSSPGQPGSGPVGNIGNWAYPLDARGTLGGTPGVGTHNGAPPYNNWQSSNALDIMVPIGTNVRAVHDGVVVKAAGSWSGGGARTDGYTITLRLASGEEIFYQHNSWRKGRIVAGAQVAKGELMARSGAGNGVPHLHIALKNGDPMKRFGFDPLVHPKIIPP